MYWCYRCTSPLFMTHELASLDGDVVPKYSPMKIMCPWLEDHQRLSPLYSNTSANITYSCNRIIIQDIYGLSQCNITWSIDSLLTFEETKVIIRRSKSKEDRQCNGQKIDWLVDSMFYANFSNISAISWREQISRSKEKGQTMICKTLHRKLQIEQSEPQVKTLVNSKCSEMGFQFH